jgi:hypothetical protein
MLLVSFGIHHNALSRLFHFSYGVLLIGYVTLVSTNSADRIVEQMLHYPGLDESREDF